MSDTIILYYSHHHGNTKKVVEAIAKEFDVECMPIEEAKEIALDKYERIGFASGIFYSKLATPMYEYVVTHGEALQGKKVFVIGTGGGNSRKPLIAFKMILKEKGAKPLGHFYCHGYDTYGPFKLVGGIRKKHPNDKDLRKAVEFYREITEQ